MPDRKPPQHMTASELHQQIRNLFQLKRDLWANISKCKETLNVADSLIDIYEKELRKRGHI